MVGSIVHEMFHVYEVKQHGFDVEEICFLGHHEIETNNSRSAIGWVVPSGFMKGNETIAYSLQLITSITLSVVLTKYLVL